MPAANRRILHVLGLVIAVFGLSMLLPLPVSLGIGGEAQVAFDKVFLLTLAVGVGLCLVSRLEPFTLLVVPTPAFWKK
ncbi:MAG: hypothetical protein HGA75_05670 [Thiobacillus sp.]|nr:hypothetical protein [Thiobacillus sp.]